MSCNSNVFFLILSKLGFVCIFCLMQLFFFFEFVEIGFFTVLLIFYLGMLFYFIYNI